MAATTTELGLVTPTQGTLPGQWGDTVNYGITEYVNIAIAGTLSFAGNGDITLANTTGSASATNFSSTTAQYMVIRITGTQTVTKVITGPSYSKLYMVDHAGATSPVEFKRAGQVTPVTIAVGEKCFVYYNGTDYVKIATSTAGTGTVTAVSVASSNGFAGTSSGGATPALTLTTSITGVLKGNGTALSAATAGTDYLAPPSGTALLKANSGGALANAAAGTDYVAPGGALGTPSSGTLSGCTVDGTNAVGYLNIPQNSQSAAYTLVLADAGKHIFHPSTDANARTYTIPANSSVAYPTGTAISFVNMTSQVVTIAINTDTMYLAGAGTTGSRSLAQYGTATALKMTSTTWIISGSGLT
jgi:hypothetical protein